MTEIITRTYSCDRCGRVNSTPGSSFSFKLEYHGAFAIPAEKGDWSDLCSKCEDDIRVAIQIQDGVA